MVLEIVTDVPTDITVDSTGAFEEWQETSPARLLLARGFWPLSWEDKQLVLPDLFPTADAARKGFARDRPGSEMRRWLDARLRGKSGQRPYKDSLIRGLSAFEDAKTWPVYRYKAVGADRAHLVAIDPGLHPRPREAWADRVGRPLGIFERIDGPKTREAKSCPPLILRLPRAPSIVSDIFGTDPSRSRRSAFPSGAVTRPDGRR